jgi:hypothetical protein
MRRGFVIFTHHQIEFVWPKGERRGEGFSREGERIEWGDLSRDGRIILKHISSNSVVRL